MVDKREIESAFLEMLKDQEKKAPNDKIYEKDMETIGELHVQWKLPFKIRGSQIFKKDSISYKFGENLENPDISLVTRNKELALRFLRGEVFEFDYGPGYKGAFKVHYTDSWKVIETETGKKNVRINKPFVTIRFNKEKEYHPYMVSKLPLFRKLVATRMSEEDIGYFIPINQSLGTYENQVIPYVVFKHFIDKASNIVILNKCGCRVSKNCKHHDHSIGCLNMGDDTLNLPIDRGRKHVATKEEALELVKKAIDDGLIPLLGRAMDEAVGAGIEDTGKFMSACFCCPCCCVDIPILKHATSELKFIKKIEGLNVVVDEDACIGCEDCIDACVWNGNEMIEGIAHITDRCLGCGRCVEACPSDAISIIFNDSSNIDALIEELESHVTVD
jgi:UDP-glucose 4-epimerase